MTVLIFGYVLLVSSVCVESVSSASYPCTLKVFEEQSADHIEDLCLDEFSDTDCRPFLKHFNRSDLPGGFSLRNDDCSVQRPESLDFTPSNSKYHDNEQEYTKPAAYVDWVSPVACLSRKHIKGYLLTWEMSAEVKCRFFKFNASRTDLLRKQLRFKYFIETLKPNELFVIKVYSMPPPENLKESQKNSTFVSVTMRSGSVNYTEPGKWKPPLNESVLKEGAIELWIHHAPSHFNLTEFDVILLKRSHSRFKAFKRTTYIAPRDSQRHKGLVTFTNLTDDEYRILVRAIDPFPDQDGKCLCWVKVTQGKSCEMSCPYRSTGWFNVSRDIPAPGNVTEKTTRMPTPTSDGDSTDTDVIIGLTTSADTKKITTMPIPASDGDSADTDVIIGVTASAVVVVAVVLLVVYKKYKKPNHPIYSMHDVPPKDPQSKQQIGLKGNAPPLKHKTILIVSTEDNPAHTRFVEQLAMFLKTHCMCYVMDPPWETLGNEFSEWVKWSRMAIGAADNILLIDSTMAENLLGSFNQTKIFMNDPSTSHTNQMFKLAQDYIWAFPDHLENFIMLYYREECGSWQHLKAPTKIQLPGGFPELLRSLHKLTEEEAKAYTNCLPLSLNYETMESNISSKLLSALLSAQRPHFETCISRKSDDTGICSDSDKISTASSGEKAISREIIMEFEGDGPPSSSQVQAMSPPELNSEYNFDEKSVFTVAVDPLIKSRGNPDKVEFVPPECIILDGRSFTSALYSFNKEDDDLLC